MFFDTLGIRVPVEGQARDKGGISLKLNFSEA
jgi:hypothetical protein